MATGKTLYVTDFDDTLAMTDANVILVRNGERITMTPSEFAVYNPQKGDQFDFSEFDKLINPRPIQRFTKLLQRVVKEKRADKIVVLTARNHTLPVTQFLRMIGITSGVAIAALGDANPEKKAKYIEKQIDDGYTRILFVDDSKKNVDSVKKLKEKYPNIKLLVHHVKAHDVSTDKQADAPTNNTDREDMSVIQQQAKSMGLTDMRFGRYGKDGKVTHIVQNGKLVIKPK